jgi:hypothetical protein
VLAEKEGHIRRLTYQAERAGELARECGTPRDDERPERGAEAVKPDARAARDGRPPTDDRAGLLRRVAAAAAENRELSQGLERLREENQATRETLEQLLQLQASSDRSSMRQVGALLRTVQELAARSQRSALAATAGDAAETGGGGGEREDDRARSGTADGGQAREGAEWSVEHSLQRLVVGMGEQIREKAALISRLEASAAQPAGESASASPSRQAQQAAARQLQAQVGELRQRRDEVRREMAEAEKRLSALRRMEEAAQQARPAQRPATAAAGPTIKIKEPLRHPAAPARPLGANPAGAH